MKNVLIFILCVLLFSSCSAKEKCEKDVFSMDTHITMTAYGKNAEKALDKAENEINRIDKKFGIDNLDINDEETLKLLDLSYKISKKTDGAFDVRVAPIMRAWGFYSEEFTNKKYTVPTADELEQAMKKMHEGKDLDLGGIAKGYCADKVVEIIKKEGVQSAVLSLGGNVALIGNNPNGKPWTVGIKNPFDDGIYATISVSDTSVVTSGDYVRFFEHNGKKYHHIIDTKTGYPADSNLSSVTVVHKNSVIADALSTAFFVMGKEKAIEYWEKDKSFDLILIDKSGKLYYTDGLKIDTVYDKVIIK